MQIAIYIVVVVLILAGLIFWGTKKFGWKKEKTIKTLKNVSLKDLTLKLTKKEKQKILALPTTTLALVKTSELEKRDQFLAKKIQTSFIKYHWEIDHLPLMIDFTNLYWESDFSCFLKVVEGILNSQAADFFLLLLINVNETNKATYNQNYQLVFNFFAENNQKTHSFFLQHYLDVSKLLLEKLTIFLSMVLANIKSWKKFEKKYLTAFKRNFLEQLALIHQEINDEWQILIDLEANKEWI